MSLHNRAAHESSTPNEIETPAEQPPAPMIISHADMDTACAQDLVIPLGHTIAYAVHYQDTWWIHFEGGWIRTDPPLAATLDAEATRLTAQDAIIARNAAIRAAAMVDREDQVNGASDALPGDGCHPLRH